MEEVLATNNIARAMKRVVANKGSAGMDRMTVDELPGTGGATKRSCESSYLQERTSRQQSGV